MKKNSLFLFGFLILLIAEVHAQKTAAITPATALQSYLHNGDNSFHWEMKDSAEMDGVKAYNILLTSQKWRQYVWTHQLTIFVPDNNAYDGALLNIVGGHTKDGMPEWTSTSDKFFVAVAAIARKNRSVVAILKQTPNEPLFDSLTEDALISYTLHQFKNDGDYSWPLLFPMVKSAIRAMDVIQDFAKNNIHHPVKRFVVSGASKRGWTTWLTGANDKRVVAIAPMVIDILNMSVNLNYQIKAWNKYSVQIEDYVKLGIPQGASTPTGKAINTMVDPYSYRKKLTMPKMIFMGTNDEYWVVDAIKKYYDSIPGRNMIDYTPNAGHNLGGGKDALESLSAFYGLTLNRKPYPACSWKAVTAGKTAKISVKTTPGILTGAYLWSAESDDMIFTKSKWTSIDLNGAKKPVINVDVKFPESGFKAFYVDLQYKDPNGGEYTQSTRMFVVDKNELKLH